MYQSLQRREFPGILTALIASILPLSRSLRAGDVLEGLFRTVEVQYSGGRVIANGRHTE